jgi:hypothetical protein
MRDPDTERAGATIVGWRYTEEEIGALCVECAAHFDRAIKPPRVVRHGPQRDGAVARLMWMHRCINQAILGHKGGSATLERLRPGATTARWLRARKTLAGGPCQLPSG